MWPKAPFLRPIVVLFFVLRLPIFDEIRIIPFVLESRAYFLWYLDLRKSFSPILPFPRNFHHSKESIFCAFFFLESFLASFSSSNLCFCKSKGPFQGNSLRNKNVFFHNLLEKRKMIKKKKKQILPNIFTVVPSFFRLGRTYDLPSHMPALLDFE